MNDVEYKIILVSGRICSGKTTLANSFHDNFNYRIVKSNDLLLTFSGSLEIEKERKSLQRFGTDLDEKTQGRWLLDGFVQNLKEYACSEGYIIDAVRNKDQIEYFQKQYGRRVVHVHLEAPNDILTERYEYRKSIGTAIKECTSYDQAANDDNEENMNYLGKIADIVIQTNKTSKKDMFIPVAARLGLLSSPYDRLVDVVVGGEYGSEGKGNICSYLAPEYNVLVRVGGPNAGHTVLNEPEPYKFHQLPSGTIANKKGKLIIAPGSVINPKVIFKEIHELGVEPGRLIIDPNAMIIDELDIKNEAYLVNSIASTGQGVGSATARKILGRGNPETKLAKDVKEFDDFIEDTGEYLEKCYCRGEKILVEGTQGTELSIHHGHYPYVTSRDTTVAGCLSEAGISPSRVRNIIMVVRTYPIRVESPSDGTSGPMEKEIDWDIVSSRSNISLEELLEKEKTTTTNRKRRVAEFDWRLFRKACSLNAPTDIALTFVDYIDIKNRDARRFNQLTPETIDFIEEIEIVARAPASIINTCFASRSIIDRRDWF